MKGAARAADSQLKALRLCTPAECRKLSSTTSFIDSVIHLRLQSSSYVHSTIYLSRQDYPVIKGAYYLFRCAIMWHLRNFTVHRGEIL